MDIASIFLHSSPNIPPLPLAIMWVYRPFAHHLLRGFAHQPSTLTENVIIFHHPFPYIRFQALPLNSYYMMPPMQGMVMVMEDLVWYYAMGHTIVNSYRRHHWAPHSTLVYNPSTTHPHPNLHRHSHNPSHIITLSLTHNIHKCTCTYTSQ